jgi:hypothetical protein
VRATKQFRGCLGLAAALAALILPGAAQADFGLQSISAEALNADGSIDLQAGSHPYEYKLNITMNQDLSGIPEGVLRDVIVELPAGLVGNPEATPRCAGAAFEGQVSNCPQNSQIGMAEFTFGGGITGEFPIFNLSTPVGVPARIGFSLVSRNSFQEASLRGSDYGVSVADQTIPKIELQTLTETIWGVPADEAHDNKRLCKEHVLPCPTDSPRLPFLNLPTSCAGPLKTTVKVDSIENPGVFDSKTVSSVNDNGIEAGLENCEAPPFNPTLSVQPETSSADSPSGLQVGIHIPQSEDPDQLATAHLKDSVVTLPRDLVVNPSAADGLGACALEGPEGINLPKSKDPNVPEPAAVSEPAKCPANSKLGTVEVRSPLVDHPLAGSVYLAKQLDNPFNSLLALYLTVEDPRTGIVVKLAGKAEPDPQTGQLKATFEENPQLPFEDLELDFFGGPRASLTTPSTCGKYTTSSDLTPWTSPEGKDAFPSDSFAIDSGASGGACPGSEAQMPNNPSFEAGTTSPLAAAYSPFLFRVARQNGSQRLASIDATLPPGLTGKLAGVSQCSDAQIAAATARNNPGEGALEKQSPSCPSGSELGTVTAGAGSGAPIYVPGHVYLAGPYKGAPLSFVFITPAIAGPFDLGTIVVRAAASIDPKTAQISVKSDQIPQILDGIPLDLRSVAVQVDKDQFTLNPTSCEQMAVRATATSAIGQAASLSNRFQVGGCKGLDYEPKLTTRLFGPTKRGGFPKLKASISAKQGEANSSKISVTLPRSEFLEQAHIGTVCTRVQFAADACPAKSVYGHVKVLTPLLDYPLTGPAYLRSSNHNLPDLVLVLEGPPSQPIELELAGRIDSVHRGIRTTFEGVPDAPFSKATLTMPGGKKGLLVNSRDVCKTINRADARFTGQSGKTFGSRPVVRNGKCGGAKG